MRRKWVNIFFSLKREETVKSEFRRCWTGCIPRGRPETEAAKADRPSWDWYQTCWPEFSSWKLDLALFLHARNNGVCSSTPLPSLLHPGFQLCGQLVHTALLDLHLMGSTMQMPLTTHGSYLCNGLSAFKAETLQLLWMFSFAKLLYYMLIPVAVVPSTVPNTWWDLINSLLNE